MQQYPKARPYKSGSSGGGGGEKRRGVVRREGRAVADDGGQFYPCGLTFMWSLQGALNEPDRYRANLAWAIAKGFDFKRPLYEVAWNPPLTINPGAAQPNMPTFPDHLGAVARDLDLAYDLGMRNGVTLSGKGTGYDYRRLARDVGNVIADGRAEKVLIVEMQNEAFNGGSSLDELKGMAREIRPLVPNLLGLSAVAGGQSEEESARFQKEMSDAIRSVGAEVFIRHLERNARGDYGWRDVRQGYDHHNDLPWVGANWEPTGPGSSGSQNTNPLQLAMLRAVSILCGAPIFVLHTGTGVYGDGKPGGTGPRPPNFWEIPGIDEIVSAIRNVEKLLPAGLPNWTVANTQWHPPLPEAPFQPHAHWEGDKGDGVNKAYAAINGPEGRFVQMPTGVRGHALMTASYPVKEVTVYNPITLEPVSGFEGRSFAKGESMDLPGGGQDAMVAYIIHGRRA